MKTIEILISPTGQTKVETKGFTGGSCREASRLIEQALGRTTADQATAEFYEPPVRQEEHQRTSRS